MGGWWVYWGIEYVQVRTHAQEMCRQAGIKTYMTPEEWKVMVGGEEAWRNIQPIEQSVRVKMWGKTIIFNQQKYTIAFQYNDRVFSYERYESYPYVLFYDLIYYDSYSGKVLFQYTNVNVGTSATNVISGLKFWIDTIPDCEDFRIWSQYKSLYFFKP